MAVPADRRANNVSPVIDDSREEDVTHGMTDTQSQHGAAERTPSLKRLTDKSYEELGALRVCSERQLEKTSKRVLFDHLQVLYGQLSQQIEAEPPPNLQAAAQDALIAELGREVRYQRELLEARKQNNALLQEKVERLEGQLSAQQRQQSQPTERVEQPQPLKGEPLNTKPTR